MLPYCPPNITLSHPWLKHGISDCFLETVCCSIIFGYLIIFGGLEYLFYRWYSTRLDGRMLRRPWLFILQITLMGLMPVLQALWFSLEAYLDKAIYIYRVQSLVFSLVIWALATRLVFLERKWAFPSTPAYGHSLGLVIFWGLALVKQCLELFNLHQTGSLFQLKTMADQISLALFILKSLGILAIFVIGLKAPGIPQSQDYYIFNWSRHHRTSSDAISIISDNLY